ncbi:MAG: DUF924 family protein [Alphaproteobacteria bacterium]|nr:DUF924 family protein [Alphaproteobacteria bacterium]
MTTLTRLNALTFCLALAAVGHTPATHAGDAMPQSVQKSGAQATPAQAHDVIAFWQDAGPTMWFAKDPAFDKRFRERFLAQHAAASRGDLAAWTSTPDGTLALLLLLDQYPRNAFRGTPRMYATDTLARGIANAAIAAGQDRAIPSELRLFVYLPFAHSENLADQERSVELCRDLGEPHLSHAIGHRDIIRRFGRFPHRNPILGRAMKAEEQKFLDEGGYAG